MAPVLNEPSSVSNILQGDSSCSPLPYSLYPRPTIIRVTPSSTIASSFQSSFMPPGGEDLITRGEWIPLLPSLASPIHSPFHRSRHSFYPFPHPPNFFKSCRLTEGRSFGFRPCLLLPVHPGIEITNERGL